jgi:hypothetical protein
MIRNDFNILPSTKLTHSNGELDEYKQKIYKDTFGNEWHEMKWYNNLLHCPANNIKLIHYCKDIEEGHLGSSEIIVAKKNIETNQETGNLYIHTFNIEEGSYNYKDFKKAGHWPHFVEDVLPVILYCSCIGK